MMKFIGWYPTNRWTTDIEEIEWFVPWCTHIRGGKRLHCIHGTFDGEMRMLQEWHDNSVCEFLKIGSAICCWWHYAKMTLASIVYFWNLMHSLTHVASGTFAALLQFDQQYIPYYCWWISWSSPSIGTVCMHRLDLFPSLQHPKLVTILNSIKCGYDTSHWPGYVQLFNTIRTSLLEQQSLGFVICHHLTYTYTYKQTVYTVS